MRIENLSMTLLAIACWAVDGTCDVNSRTFNGGTNDDDDGAVVSEVVVSRKL